MQSPEVDWSVFNDKGTFSESNSCSGSKLHKYTLEQVLFCKSGNTVLRKTQRLADWSVFHDEVTFGKSKSFCGSKLHEDTLEQLLCQWQFGFLWGWIGRCEGKWPSTALVW